MRSGAGHSLQCTSDGVRFAPAISNTQKSSPITGTDTL
jgi:hypothetical protein